MEAYKIACGAGISPVDFWNMTPYLVREAVGALHQGNNQLIWIQAALMRAKKLPKLNEFIKEKKSTASFEVRLKDAFKGHNVRKGK